MKQQVQEILIKNHRYYIHGSDTHTIKELAEIMNIKHDGIKPCKLSLNNGLIKIWTIGELDDYLKEKNSKS